MTAIVTTPKGQPGFWATVVADFDGWVKSGEHFVEAEAIALWNDVFKPVIVGIPQKEATILVNLIKTGVADLQSKSLEQVEAELLNMAVTNELAFLKSTGSSVIQGFVAFVKAQLPKG